MRRTRLVGIGVALALAALVPACGSSSSSNKSADTGGSAPAAKTAALDPTRDIRAVGNSGTVASWDPATTPNVITQITRFYNNVYDTILRFDDKDQLQPNLATKWSYDPTNTVLTLTLRSDVTFTDGSKFDATVAKANLDRNQKGTSFAAAMLAGIKSTEVKSPTELVITQSDSGARVLLALGSDAAAMVSPLALQNPSSIAQHPVGSGPFTLTNATGTTTSFTRNDNYWNKSVKYAAHMVIIGAADFNARENALLSGQADWAQLSQNPPSPQMQAKIEAGQYKEIIGPFTPLLLGLNNKIPPLDNPKVVQAINYAIDRDQLNQVIYNGLCKPAAQLAAPGRTGYVDGLQYKYDLAKAQQLMTEAGVGKVHVSFQGVAGVPTAQVELYASMLAKIGITLDITNSPPPLVANNFYSGKFGLSILGFFLSAPDPIFATDYMTGGFNPGTKDPTLVSMVNKANLLPLNDPGRNKAYQDITRYIFDHPVAIPLCNTPNVLISTPEVVGMDQIPQAWNANMDTSRMGLKPKS
jgi:peptide/nickel transport system substrate-binding protein